MDTKATSNKNKQESSELIWEPYYLIDDALLSGNGFQLQSENIQKGNIISFNLLNQLIIVPPLKIGLVYYPSILKCIEGFENLQQEEHRDFLFYNVVTNCVARSAILHHLILLLKKEKYPLKSFAEVVMPILSMYLKDLDLSYPYDGYGYWKDKFVCSVFLNVCKQCLRNISPPIPDDNLCPQKSNPYKDTCREKYARYFIDKLYIPVEEVKDSLFRFYSDLPRTIPLKNGKLDITKIKHTEQPITEQEKNNLVEKADIRLLKIADIIKKRILKNKSILISKDFFPYAHVDYSNPYLESDKDYYISSYTSSNIKQNKKVIFGVIEEGLPYLSKVKKDLRPYAFNKLLELAKRTTQITGQSLISKE